MTDCLCTTSKTSKLQSIPHHHLYTQENDLKQVNFVQVSARHWEQINHRKNKIRNQSLKKMIKVSPSIPQARTQQWSSSSSSSLWFWAAAQLHPQSQIQVLASAYWSNPFPCLWWARKLAGRPAATEIEKEKLKEFTSTANNFDYSSFIRARFFCLLFLVSVLASSLVLIWYGFVRITNNDAR